MTEYCKNIVGFLGCDYVLFENEPDAERVMACFHDLTAQGKAEGFYPLIVVASDTLAEKLELFLEQNNIEPIQESIAAYHQGLIETAEKTNAPAFFAAQYEKNIAFYNAAEYDLLGEFGQAEPNDNLRSFLDFLPGRPPRPEIIVAKIPAKSPWELAVWLPMGGFNACPAPEIQAAMFRHWHTEYGAVPAAVTYDIWEMTVTKPPATDEEAEKLAKEQYVFCEDIVSQGYETIRNLASVLKNSKVWYFWWD